MANFVRALKSILQAQKAGEHDVILKTLDEIRRDETLPLSRSARGEFALIEATTLSAMFESDRADKTFQEALKLFENQLFPENRIRTELFQARFYLKSGRLGDAEKVLSNISTIPLCTTDPYLSALFFFCKAELRYIQYSGGKLNMRNWLIEDLERFLENSSILRYPGMFTGEELLLSNREIPAELLLSLYQETNSNLKALNLIQYMKNQSLSEELIFSPLPWQYNPVKDTRIMKNSINKMKEKIRDYTTSLFHIHPFIEEFKQYTPEIISDPDNIFDGLREKLERTRNVQIAPRELKKILEISRKEIAVSQKDMMNCIESSSVISPINGSFFLNRNFPISIIQNMMDESQLALDYCLTAGNLFCAVVSKKELKIYRISKTREEILNLHNDILSTMENTVNAPPDEKKLQDLLHSAYQTLVHPLNSETAGKDRIFILPHSILCHIPFSSLWNGKAHLCRAFKISILPSLIYLKKYLSHSKTVLDTSKLIKVTGIMGATGGTTESITLSRIELQPGPEPGSTEPVTGYSEMPEADLLLCDQKIPLQRFQKDFLFMMSGGKKNLKGISALQTTCWPTAIILNGIDYSSADIETKAHTPLEKYAGFSFLMGSDFLIANLWRVPPEVTAKFLERFFTELKANNVLDAFSFARDNIIVEFGPSPCFWSAFQIFASNCTLELSNLKNNADLKLNKILDTGSKLLVPPLVRDGILYTGGEDGYIYSVNSSNGSHLWKYKTGDWMSNSFSVDENFLYAGSMDKRVFAFGKTNGIKQWEFKTRGWISDRPLYNDSIVFAVSKDGYLYFIHRTNGQMKRRYFLGDINKGYTQLNNSYLIVAMESREKIKILCFDSHRLTFTWEVSVPGQLEGRGHIDGSNYYFSDSRGYFYSVNLMNGKILWKLENNGKIRENSLVCSEGMAYLIDEKGEVLAITPREQTVKWRTRLTSSPESNMVIYRKRLCVICQDGQLHCLDPRNGLDNMKISLGSITGQDLVVENGELYILNRTQGIYLLRDRNSPDLLTVDESPDSAGNVFFLTSRIDRLGNYEAIKSESSNQSTTSLQIESISFSKPSLGTGSIIGKPMVLKNTVVLCKAGKIIELFDLNNFSSVWKTQLRDEPRDNPAHLQGILIVAGADGHLYSLDIRNGNIIKESKVCNSLSTGPVPGKKTVFMGSEDGNLYCVSNFRGKVVWKAKTGGKVLARPEVYKKSVIFASGDGYIYRVDAETGDSIWRTKTLSPNFHDPQVLDNRILIAGYDGTIYYLNANNGNVEWKYICPGEEFSGPPLITGQLVVASTRKGAVFVLNLLQGTLIRKMVIKDKIWVKPEDCGNEIVVGTVSGKFVFFDKNSDQITRTYNLNAPIVIPFEVRQKAILAVEGNASITLIPLDKQAEMERHRLKQEKQEKQDDSSTEKSEQEQTSDSLENQKLSRDRKVHPLLQGSAGGEKMEFRRRLLEESEPSKLISKSSTQSDMEYMLIFLLIAFVLMGAFSLISRNTLLLILSIIALFITGFFLVVERLQDENVRMKQLFHRFVPSHLLNRYIKGGKAEEEKNITVLFQDIYNYTTISEAISNEELYSLLQQIDAITDKIVSKYNGEIMSYIGDAYMITFNAVNTVKEHSIMAVRAALEINQAMRRLGDKRKIPGEYDMPMVLKMGFGIHTGPAIVGIRGGKTKLEPFVLGDTANIAARLQNLTRELECDIIISETTHNQLGNLYRTKSLGKSRLKGKNNPIEIYTVMQDNN